MRHETVRKLDRITRGQVRPLRALEARQLGKVFEVDAGNGSLLEAIVASPLDQIA
ncbi:MAG: hypothetical protein ABR589_06885 [Chthoniobacterales bacterium]